MFSAYIEIIKPLWVSLYKGGYTIIVTQTKEKALSGKNNWIQVLKGKLPRIKNKQNAVFLYCFP